MFESFLNAAKGMWGTSQGTQVATDKLKTQGMTSGGATDLLKGLLPSNPLDRLKASNSGGLGGCLSGSGRGGAIGMLGSIMGGGMGGAGGIFPAGFTQGGLKPGSLSGLMPSGGGMGGMLKGMLGGGGGMLPGGVSSNEAQLKAAAANASSSVRAAYDSRWNTIGGAKTMLGKSF